MTQWLVSVWEGAKKRTWIVGCNDYNGLVKDLNDRYDRVVVKEIGYF